MADTFTDWFVAADSRSGDGSRERPFHDPWLALFSAGPGDVVHIAAGTYFGRFDRSSWIVDCPRLTVRGGYSRDFSQRTPWHTPAVFAAFPGYEFARESALITGGQNHSGVILDGLFFDGAGRNDYGVAPEQGIRRQRASDGPLAIFNGDDVTIRNCVFANSGSGGVTLRGAGSRFENNLVCNILGLGMLELRGGSDSSRSPISVLRNGFCFAHDDSMPAGEGADHGMGIRVNCPAIVADNVFVSCGNAAVALYRDVGRAVIERNVFHVTPRDVLNCRVQGNSADITEANIDEIEDVGLKSAAGNLVRDPGMAGFKVEWLDACTRYLLGHYAKPPFESANSLRRSAGLADLRPTDVDTRDKKGALAPPLAPLDALALRFAEGLGCQVLELPVEIAGQPVTPAPSCRPIDWSVITTADPSLANERVELRAGIGEEQNAALLSDADPTSYMGIRIYQPMSDDGSILVLARRHTLTQRQFERAIRYSHGRDVEQTYFVRGTYRTDVVPSWRQRVTLVVDAILLAPLLSTPGRARARGRDWFVKAGASGGDGTREKPFRDPFLALEKAEGGDTIHVAGGDYFGKLSSGHWTVGVRHLTLLGGYDADFTERNPWDHPTRFVLKGQEKLTQASEGAILASAENSEGLVLDGFVFDGASYNTYATDGSLNLRNSPHEPLVSLAGRRAPIAVRNCLFVNASASAVNIRCPSGEFANNIVLNSSGRALTVTGDGPGPWIIRDNSFLFGCDPTSRAGTGESSSDGTLLQLGGRASTSVSSNIFAFADNCGVRSTIAQRIISFDRNVFAANLYAHLTDGKYFCADDSSWERRAVVDSGFRSCTENSLELPNLPVDPSFADRALTRLFALPSKISAARWQTLAHQIGSPATPAAATSAAPADASTAETGPPGSLSGLLAGLGSIRNQMEKEDARKAAEPSEPVYCAAFGWQQALALALHTSDTAPGAHKLQLEVSFAAAHLRSELVYTQVTPEAIDQDAASWHDKPVEVHITEPRLSSSDPSLFPPDTTREDYAAYTVAMFPVATRTRTVLIVSLDTVASRVLGRAALGDTLRIRGTARSSPSLRTFSIIVDTAEAVDR